jgi:hypothetical protein
MIGLTAGLLAYLKTHQRLGRPGVIVADVPMFDTEGKKARPHTVVLPEKLSKYESKALPLSIAECNTLPDDTTFGKRIYRGEDGFQTLVNVVLMGSDRTSIHKPQFCLKGQGWAIDPTEQVVTIRMKRPFPYDLPVMKLNASFFTKDQQGKPFTVRGVYVYWFVDESQITARHGQRMWWMARDLLLNGVLQRWAYVSCFSQCLPGQEQATFDRMATFIAESVPEFQLVPGEQSKSLISRR